jgi:hypothetical protein
MLQFFIFFAVFIQSTYSFFHNIDDIDSLKVSNMMHGNYDPKEITNEKFLLKIGQIPENSRSEIRFLSCLKEIEKNNMISDFERVKKYIKEKYPNRIFANIDKKFDELDLSKYKINVLSICDFVISDTGFGDFNEMLKFMDLNVTEKSLRFFIFSGERYYKTHEYKIIRVLSKYLQNYLPMSKQRKEGGVREESEESKNIKSIILNSITKLKDKKYAEIIAKTCIPTMFLAGDRTKTIESSYEFMIKKIGETEVGKKIKESGFEDYYKWFQDNLEKYLDEPFIPYDIGDIEHNGNEILIATNNSRTIKSLSFRSSSVRSWIFSRRFWNWNSNSKQFT